MNLRTDSRGTNSRATDSRGTNLRAMAAIVRRDLVVVRSNRAVLVPLVVMPALFVVGFPLLAALIARVEASTAQVAELMRAAPPALAAGLPGGAGPAVAAFFLVYLLPPLTLLVPLIVVMVLATDAVAGERDRGTLEGLLMAPVSDRDLVLAKLAGALLPAFGLLLVSQLTYLVIVDVAMWSYVGGPLLPTVDWAVMVFWLGPSLAAAALALAVVISTRARTVQGAQQIAGLAVLPLVGVVVGQFTGLLFVSAWLSLPAGALLWLLAAALVRFGARGLSRDRLGARLG